MNIQRQNFLEQQLILKEIELEAYQKFDEGSYNNAEAIVAVEISILKREIALLKKGNFPEDKSYD